MSFAHATGLYFLFAFIFALILDSLGSPFVNLSMVLALFCPTLVLLYRQYNYLSHTAELIRFHNRQLDVTRDHIRLLNRQKDPEQGQQVALIGQIHRNEAQLLADKRHYNQAVENYNSVRNSLPIRFIALLLGLDNKDYYSDFLN